MKNIKIYNFDLKFNENVFETIVSKYVECQTKKWMAAGATKLWQIRFKVNLLRFDNDFHELVQIAFKEAVKGVTDLTRIDLNQFVDGIVDGLLESFDEEFSEK